VVSYRELFKMIFIGKKSQNEYLFLVKKWIFAAYPLILNNPWSNCDCFFTESIWYKKNWNCYIDLGKVIKLDVWGRLPNRLLLKQTQFMSCSKSANSYWCRVHVKRIQFIITILIKEIQIIWPFFNCFCQK